MSRTHWHERWDAGRLGFHVDAPNTVLRRYLHHLPRGRILVPLSGKSLDLWLLAESGFTPIGVELVPKAVEDLFAERGLTPEIESGDHGMRYRGGGIEVHLADVFDFRDAPFDGVWDRAALIALQPTERRAYAARLLELLRPGGVMLLDTLDYDPSLVDGPPWAITADQVGALYQAAGELTLLEDNAPVPLPPHMEAAGAVGRQRVWLLRRA